MSEDRTQEPSRRRRDLARQRGQVARSPELTAAVGMLAAVVLIGAWGGDLTTALVQLVREPLETTSPPPSTTIPGDPAVLVDSLRRAAGAVALPLGMILGGVVVAMVAAHQLQTGGLWAPGLLAPDIQRLWAGPGGGEGLATRFARGLRGLLRAAAIVTVATWMIRTDLPALAALTGLEVPSLARAVGSLLKGFAYVLGLALLGLGLLDFVGQYRHLEARLRLSPDQQREELKAADGDPEFRARRIRLARSWLREPREAMTGAALIVTGAGGVAVLLGGKPPPGRVAVRLVARGAAASTLRRTAERAGLPHIEATPLAYWFAQARNAGNGASLPPELAAKLAAIWPDKA